MSEILFRRSKIVNTCYVMLRVLPELLYEYIYMLNFVYSIICVCVWILPRSLVLEVSGPQREREGMKYSAEHFRILNSISCWLTGFLQFHSRDTHILLYTLLYTFSFRNHETAFTGCCHSCCKGMR